MSDAGVSERAKALLEDLKAAADARRPAPSLRDFLVPGLLFAVGFVTIALGNFGAAQHTQRKAQRTEDERTQQAQADQRFGPALQQAKQAISPVDHLNAFRDFAAQTDCHAAQIAHVLNGNSAMGNCRGSAYPLRPGRESIDGSISGQLISFSYTRPLRLDGASGELTSRVRVQPITPQLVGPANKSDNPVALLIQTRGVEYVRGFAERGRCAALSYEVVGNVVYETGEYMAGTRISSRVYGDAVSGVFAGCLDDAGHMHPV